VEKYSFEKRTKKRSWFRDTLCRKSIFGKLTICCAFTLLPQGGEAKVLTSYAEVAKRAIPGVVNIRTTTYKGSDSQAINLYEFFLEGKLPRSSSTHAVGSGVIIDKKGRILTNYHVIKDANRIEVLFAKSKKKLSATVIGTDLKTDLALLKVSGSPGEARPLDLGNSDALAVGDVVLAIGNPFGYAHTVTSGIISATGRVIGAGPYDNFLQTDASIHPGNSGGPLIDIRGRVIGINTAVSAKGAGIGFAIPINLAKQVTRDLVRFGKVKRPWLGIVGQNILSSEDVGTSAGTEGVYGVIIANLIVEGPAHKAGLRVGDLIMGLGDAKVSDLNHLHRLLGGKSPAERVRLKVYHRGKGFRHVNISLEEFPKTEDLPVEQDVL
jgi:serine protease Do